MAVFLTLSTEDDSLPEENEIVAVRFRKEGDSEKNIRLQIALIKNDQWLVEETMEPLESEVIEWWALEPGSGVECSEE